MTLAEGIGSTVSFSVGRTPANRGIGAAGDVRSGPNHRHEHDEMLGELRCGQVRVDQIAPR